jgi:hypothetical protein
MDATVKAAMLKSSQVMTLSPKDMLEPPTARSLTLRRVHSTESLNSPGSTKIGAAYNSEPPHAQFAGGQVSAHHPSSISGSPTPRKTSSHTRGLSFDGRGLFSRSQVHLPTSGSTLDLAATTKNGKERIVVAKNISPTKFFSLLSGASSTQLEVEDVKKLRLLLRNESAR